MIMGSKRKEPWKKNVKIEFLDFDEPAVSQEEPGAADLAVLIGMYCSDWFCPHGGLSPSD